MELVDGQSLAVLLAGGPLGPAHAMDVVSQTAAGLHAAHLAGLVHRDIKPGNLLITRDGHVKITDFGIAHLAGSSPVTRTGMLVGTPAYLAPERVAGAQARYQRRVLAWRRRLRVPVARPHSAGHLSRCTAPATSRTAARLRRAARGGSAGHRAHGQGPGSAAGQRR
jgi:serine/threonine protein kinase